MSRYHSSFSRYINYRVILAVIVVLFPWTSLHAQTEDIDSQKYNFWEHLYIPLEMGLSISTNPNQDPSYLVNSCLEYRFGRTRGWFVMGEFDEHTHSYKDKQIQEANTIRGDVKYTDWIIGPGWRQPLYKKLSGTVIIQPGFTVSALKHVSLDLGDQYYLEDNKKTVPTAKFRLGIEYVFDPSYNVYIQVCHTQHLKATQLEHDKPKGVINISAGFNMSLF